MTQSHPDPPAGGEGSSEATSDVAKRYDMNPIIQTTTEKTKRIQKAVLEHQKAVVKQMLILATNGFGLVAALAWNNVIQEFINEYVKKWFTVGSGLISLLLYAILITLLAVSVTLQLSSISEKLESNKEEKENKS